MDSISCNRVSRTNRNQLAHGHGWVLTNILLGWANTNTFPPKTGATPPVPTPGIDPIIGVGNPRQMVGTSPDVAGANQELNFAAKWVIPRGGEYFFSPSIPALKKTFAAPGSPGHHEL